MIENEQTEGAGASGRTERNRARSVRAQRQRSGGSDSVSATNCAIGCCERQPSSTTIGSAIEKERRELSEWAAADVISEVLAVLDDFDRALSTEAPPEAQGYRTGVELIRRQLGEVLRKRGVTPLETLGTDFDPHLHQAVAYEESPGAREGEVVGELRKGYRLGERLLRPAMVRVAKAS